MTDCDKKCAHPYCLAERIYRALSKRTDLEQWIIEDIQMTNDRIAEEKRDSED